MSNLDKAISNLITASVIIEAEIRDAYGEDRDALQNELDALDEIIEDLQVMK